MPEVLDRHSHVPLYYQFKQCLLERIEEGEFPPGQPITVEVDLAKAYCISRATVRRAMQEMTHDGYIHRIPGKGTFILRTRIQRGLTRMSSFSEDMKERGQEVTARFLEVGLKQPQAYIAEQFHMSEKESILYICRIRLVNDLPLALNYSYIKLPERVSISEEELRETFSLWSLLERKGVPLIETDKVIEAVLATDERARLLDVPVGTALLQVEGMAYTINHLPVEFSQVISPGERYKYLIHLER